jgi:phosphoglycolate phosphatase
MRDGLEALVFDLDGTLVDTAADIHLVLADVLAEEGLPAPAPAAVRGMIGDGARALVERALAAATGKAPEPSRVDRLGARFRARYAEVPCRASAVYPGGRELLERAAAGGLRLGLCTNKPQEATEGLLAALGLSGWFGAVVGGDVLPVRKPDPGHLAAVLAALGTPPARAAMVGDSRNDLLTARALGVPCVLVSFGYTAVPAAELGADAVVDRLEDLPDALARLDRPLAPA